MTRIRKERKQDCRPVSESPESVNASAPFVTGPANTTSRSIADVTLAMLTCHANVTVLHLRYTTSPLIVTQWR